MCWQSKWIDGRAFLKTSRSVTSHHSQAQKITPQQSISSTVPPWTVSWRISAPPRVQYRRFRGLPCGKNIVHDMIACMWSCNFCARHGFFLPQFFMCAAACRLLIVAARPLSSFGTGTMPVHIFYNLSNFDIHLSASCSLLLSVACLAFSLLYDLLHVWLFHYFTTITYLIWAHSSINLHKPGAILLLQYQSHKSKCFAFPLLFAHHLSAFERTNLHKQSWPAARIFNHTPPPMTHTQDFSEFRNSLFTFLLLAGRTLSCFFFFLSLFA